MRSWRPASAAPAWSRSTRCSPPRPGSTGSPSITLDQTGLAQKGGAVVSSIVLSEQPIEAAAKIGYGNADLLLGFDLLGAASAENLKRAHPERTVAVVNTAEIPTGDAVRGATRAGRTGRTGRPDQRLHAARPQRLRRRHPPRRRPVRQPPGGERVPAGRGVSGRAASARGGVDRGSDPPEPRGGRSQPAGVPVGPQVLPGRARGGGAARAAARQTRSSPIWRAELERYQNRAYAERYREFLREVEARAAGDPRDGGALSLQADGVQGRVRSGAPADAARVRPADGRDVGAGGIDRLQPASAAAALPGHEEEAEAGRVVPRSAADAGRAEIPARHGLRSVRLCARSAARSAR